MTKIGIITDTHYGVRNDAPIFYDYFKKSLDYFFQTMEENNIKHIIHLGDLYDRRKYVNYVTAKRCREDFLERTDKYQTHILSGNHDEYYKNTHVINSLTELIGDRYKNITIHTVPKMVSIDGFDIQLIPWITHSNYEQSITQIQKSSATILMGHLQFAGFEEQKGKLANDGLDPKIFDKYESVYTGHFHHRHRKGNIQYVGAFAEYFWSDYNDPRGFNIFDTETSSMSFYQNPYSMFKMVQYDDSKKNIIEEITTNEYVPYSNTFTKIVVSNKTNPYAFDLLLGQLEKVHPYDISVVEDVSAFVENGLSDEIDEAEDTPTILNKYIDSLTLSVDSDKIKRLLFNIYIEALNLETI